MATQSNSSPRFDVHPSVVFRLGEELVTDPIQAIIELAKNSYDAGSARVNISIATIPAHPSASRINKKSTYLLLEDFGSGMTREQLERGWLVIANSPKRALKNSKKIPPNARTPLGDKGLGRLGIQKIGRQVEVITRSDADPKHEHRLFFDWANFEKAQTLGEVPVDISTVSGWSGKKPGTTIIISGLKDPDFWATSKSIKRLASDLSKMLTPYPEIRTCTVSLKVNDVYVALQDVTSKIRNSAPARYFVAFDGTTLTVKGQCALDLFRPRLQNRDDLAAFERFCSSDRGARLFDYFVKKKLSKAAPDLRRSKDDQAFIEFQRSWDWTSLDELQSTEGDDCSPGPFFGEVNYVNLDREPGQVLDSRSELQNTLKGSEGVRLFRDGFGIRVDEDWLGLGRGQTSGRSFYGLRPGNVFGYVALTARDNPQIQETTSREGLIRNSEANNFLRLLAAFVEFANNAQGRLRRTALEFLHECRGEEAGVSDTDDTAAVMSKLKEAAKALSKAKGNLRKRTAGTPQKAVGKSTSRPSGEDEQTLQIVEEANKHVNDFLAMQDVIQRREAALREEIASMYEMVSLGITAESLAHEINHIADDLVNRAAGVNRYLAKQKISDLQILSFVEHARGSATGLRKQLAFLSPSLKYVRENRETISMTTFVSQLIDHYQSRLEGKGIQITVETSLRGDFSLSINRGKLNQIFENLMLNSQYWVSEALNSKRIKSGSISIVIDRPFIKVFDNGPGVDPAIEDSLFDPFVSGKRSGRGLGLFIVKQLLGSENCSIYLLPERNRSRRPYIFQLDFKGALNARS